MPLGCWCWERDGAPHCTDTAAAFQLLTPTCSSRAVACLGVRPSLVSLKQSHCPWVVPRAPLLIVGEPTGQFDFDQASKVLTFGAF